MGVKFNKAEVPGIPNASENTMAKRQSVPFEKQTTFHYHTRQQFLLIASDRQ
jgi:hypothetical protein